MKPDEIKKALECCTDREKTFSCSGCPFESIPYCGKEIMRGSLEIINNQQAEIKNLKAVAEYQQKLSTDRYFEIEKLKAEMVGDEVV